jgi:[ribosomal protein S5]-alanine N-acetyltransferase
VTPSLRTSHLTLQPYLPEQLLALIDGVAKFEESMEMRSGDGLRDFFVSEEVSPHWLALLRMSSAADPWIFGFAVIHDDDRRVIGGASFKGPPDEEGVVEIAYGIVPAYQNRGYATEAASALVGFARERVDVRTIRAHTLPEPNASTHVLTKCGFQQLGEIDDPDDGPVWRWERVVD